MAKRTDPDDEKDYDTAYLKWFFIVIGILLVLLLVFLDHLYRTGQL